MDIYESNRTAWDEEVRRHNYWTLIASEDQIQQALQGTPELRITPFKSVPLTWIENLRGKNILCACGGGGQQVPILSAYGCNVTGLDLSPSQVNQDRLALSKYGLKAEVMVGNVMDLPFSEHSFDAVIIPEALNFVEDIKIVYREVRRVLKTGGTFMTGVANPILYAFDDKVQEKKLRIKYTIPFADTVSLSKKELEKRLAKKDTVEFSFTLEDILGGLIEAGFVIEGFYSDESGSELTDSFVHDCHIAYLAKAK